MEAPNSANETARLEALRGYGILDTPPEPELDALTRLASRICATPMALLTLVDGERQWFKSRVGIDLEETPRGASFCTHAIEQPGLFIVHDALEDPRFAGNPHVVAVPGIRFYAGAPLLTPEGHALGTLCVVDRVPRTLTAEQMEALRTLAGQAMAQLELKRQVGRLSDALERQDRSDREAAAALEGSLSLLRATLESAADGLLVIDREGHVVTANRKFAAMWGIDPAALEPGSEAPLEHCARQVTDCDAFRAHVLELRADPHASSFDEVPLRDGRILELYSQPQLLGTESVGRVWSYRDVTERRRAEEEARRTAERMRAVAGAAAAVVGAATPAELRSVLEEACRTVLTFDAFFIFGYEPRGHLFHGFGGNDAGVYTPPDVTSAAGTPGERVVRERRSLLTQRADDPAGLGASATGTGRRSESVLRTPILVGGEVRGIISVQSYTPERFSAADVEVVEALASLAATALENIRLTSERAEAEAALRRSETRFRTLFEQFPFSIQIFSPDGETLRVNQAWERLFHGLLPGERPRFNPLTDPQLAGIRPLIERGFAGEGVELPATLFDPTRVGRAEAAPDGSGARWLHASICPVKDEDGGIREVILVHQDVTEERRAVEELRQARDELERRVQERTAELAETNLALEEEVAERARAEEEVVQKSAELQAVFHALPDLYFRMEADGTILDSQAGHEMGMYTTPDLFLGRRVQEILPPGVGDRIGEALERVAADGRLTTVEYALDGQEYEARLLPLDSGGQVVGIVRDITERKGWERELRRREEHFRALIENASDLISVLDEEGAYRYQSPSVHRILGYAPDDLLGRHPFHFMHPDDVAGARAALERMLADPESSQTVQFRFRHADGSWRVLESTGRTLVPGAPGEGVVVNSRDVTERNKAEEALRRSEEHFRAVIENASDLVTILEPDGVMRYQSPAVERLFGFQPAELEGRSAFELIHPDDAAGVVEALTAVAQNPGETRSAAFRFLHKDGSWRHVESVGTTLSRTGVEEGVIVNSRDVTERKKAEEALEQARAEAERAREAAEAANAAKSEFLSRMSHELRTPMNSILGFAQLLERRSPTPEQQRSVDQILRAGRHLLNLINEVLDIARIESDRQTLSLEPVRVDTALSEAVNLIRPLAAQNDCSVADPQPAPGRWVRADRQRLAQILLNLLSNGVKYNRPGGTVRVTWEDAGGRLRIGVHDTGRGIAPERMAELFVPFARLGAEETGVEGTGLGLALSHRLAEAMGGTLTAESDPERGSTFWLELPVDDDPSSRLPRTEPAEREARGEAPAGPPATLLYVEDNLANLTLVESLLSTRPEITLLSAMQGRMGLDLAWEHAPDLILLDLHLPDMPGSEVLRRLRADERTRDTPVVVISADATPGQVERLRAAGAHDYMTKPLDLDRFMDAVDRTLALRRGDAP